MAVAAVGYGDFSGLAQNYARYRPGYCPSVVDVIIALVGKPVAQMDVVDVGAGTGIWTRLLAGRGCRSVTAIEPNENMRTWGMKMTAGTPIVWQAGAGEATGMLEASADLLSMASSFHWVDFEKGLREFHRVLRPNGRFVAVWNPRLIEVNPILVEIEAYLVTLKPDISRVSSGRSGIAARLTEMLSGRSDFGDVVYVEGRHSVFQTTEDYIGVWRSVNDVQHQLGPAKFRQFLEFIEDRLHKLQGVETTYLTRAWVARRQ